MLLKHFDPLLKNHFYSATFEILKIISPDDERLSYFIDLSSEYFLIDIVDYIQEAGKNSVSKEQVYNNLGTYRNKLHKINEIKGG